METASKSPVVSPVTNAETAGVAVAPPTTEVATAKDTEAGITSGEDQGTGGNTSIAEKVAVAVAPTTNEVANPVNEEGERSSGEATEAPQSIGRRGRGKGRRKGSKNATNVASSSGRARISTGKNFMPYILTIEDGEDIAQRLAEFNENVSKSSSVLCAQGNVCKVDISHQTYEGNFDICKISAVRIVGGSGEMTTALSITLIDMDGKCFGGNITGPVIAAGKVHIVMAAFTEEKIENKRGGSSLAPIPETEPPSDETPAPDDEDQKQMPKETETEPPCNEAVPAPNDADQNPMPKE